MQLITLKPSHTQQEVALLFSLRFACLLSRYGYVMDDPKVMRRSAELLKHLRHQGPSAQFRARFICDPEVGKATGAALDDHFYMTISQDLATLTIHRTCPPRSNMVWEVRCA